MIKIIVMIFICCVAQAYVNASDGGEEVLVELASQGPEAITLCQRDIAQMIFSIQEPWSVQMLDSCGKIGSGTLLSNVRWDGNPGECRKVNAPAIIGNGFKGKYCKVHLASELLQQKGITKMPVKAVIGVCVPDTCDSKAIMDSFSLLSKFLGGTIPMLRNASQFYEISKCECPPKSPDSSILTEITVFILGFIVFLVCFSTLMDYFWFRPRERIERELKREEKYGKTHGSTISNNSGSILLCFSGLRNASAILDITESDPQLSFLHGVRVLSIIWIVFGHCHSHQASIERNLLDHVKSARKVSFQFAHHGFYAVDTFFFLSSFLFMYMFLKNSKTKMTVKNAVFILVYRYLRTSPPMLAIFSFTHNVLRVLGTGSEWPVAVEGRMNCADTWWTFPLYINNYFKGNEECGTYLWYLGMDYQLFAASLIVIAMYQRSPALGTTLCVSIICFSSLLNTSIAFSNGYQTFFDYSGMLLTEPTKGLNLMRDTFENIHSMPYTRGVVFWLGLLYATYFFRIQQQKKTKISSHKRLDWNDWQAQLGVAILSFLFVIIAPVYLDRGRLGNALFLSISRLLWGLGVALVFHICLNKPKSIPTRLLSWKGWRIASRLTFCVYLLHSVIMDWVFWNADQLITYSFIKLFTTTLGILLATYVLAFFTSIVFEAPFIKLGKQLMEKKKK